MLGNVQTLTANKDQVFDLVRLAMTKPRFDEDAVERVRAQILAGLKFDENDPETVASLAWDRLAFQNHPYGRPIKGTIESISTITHDDLKNYARRVFARDKLVISVVGDIDPETLGKALQPFRSFSTGLLLGLLLGQHQAVGSMGAFRQRLLATCFQLFQSVFANRFQHYETRLTARVLDLMR